MPVWAPRSRRSVLRPRTRLSRRKEDSLKQHGSRSSTRLLLLPSLSLGFLNTGKLLVYVKPLPNTGPIE